MILPLSLMPDIDTYPCAAFTADARGADTPSLADMLFRALDFIFSPRTFGAAAPPWRSAAFAKRLLTACLQWSPAITLRTIDFVGGLVAKDVKLESLLSTEDRSVDGVYRHDVDDPQVCNPFGTSFWELHVLQRHWDSRVREEAIKLSKFSRSSTFR
jgi:nucleolar complex protein 3